jgi:hypothetical protein
MVGARNGASGGNLSVQLIPEPATAASGAAALAVVLLLCWKQRREVA